MLRALKWNMPFFSMTALCLFFLCKVVTVVRALVLDALSLWAVGWWPSRGSNKDWCSEKTTTRSCYRIHYENWCSAKNSRRENTSSQLPSDCIKYIAVTFIIFFFFLYKSACEFYSEQLGYKWSITGTGHNKTKCRTALPCILRTGGGRRGAAGGRLQSSASLYKCTTGAADAAHPWRARDVYSINQNTFLVLYK